MDSGLPALRKELAGAAAIPGVEPSDSRSFRLRADQSQDSDGGEAPIKYAFLFQSVLQGSFIIHDNYDYAMEVSYVSAT